MRETIEAVRVLGFWRVVFYRTLYRPLMKLAHRYNWHYAPVGGPDRNCAWCQWCGLRYTVPTLREHLKSGYIRTADRESAP